MMHNRNFCTFSEKFIHIRRKNITGNTNVLTISAQHGLINQFEYYNNQYASEDTSGYTLLHKGEFAYNKSYSEGYPLGATKKLERYESGIVSPLYICFAAKDGVCVDFYSYYFESEPFYREIYKIAQEGARNHGLLNVPAEDFFKMKIADPPLEEQRRIAEILGCCDQEITLKQELIAEKKKQKKALMQRLLNSDSGFRLPGFAGGWQKGELKDVCEINVSTLSEKADQTLKFQYIDLTTVSMGRFIHNPSVTTFSQAPCRARRLLKKGDILFSTVRPYLCGIILVDFDADNFVASTGFAVLHPINQKINRSYLYHYLFSDDIITQGQHLLSGSNYPALNTCDVERLGIWMPTNINEQQAIADILSAADREIDLLEKELVQQEQKKKSLMQLLLTGIARV